jgi:hypothetical protein
MVTSPFVIYNGTTALDVRKATMWSAITGAPTQLGVYIRGTPEIPVPVVTADFIPAKQDDCDASAFVR